MKNSWIYKIGYRTGFPVKAGCLYIIAVVGQKLIDLGFWLMKKSGAVAEIQPERITEEGLS